MIIVSRLRELDSLISIDYMNTDKHCTIEKEKEKTIGKYGIPEQIKSLEVNGNIKMKYYNKDYGHHWILLVKV